MSSDTIITFVVTFVLVLFVFTPYYLRVRKREEQARRSYEHAKISGLQTATTSHPQIDVLICIGCGGCVSACPEGDVLAVVRGKAVLVHGSKCVGHALCAEACPVGGITMMLAAPGRNANLPVLSEFLETTVPDIYIAGELGGLGLIRNAVTQGRTVVEHIASRQRAGNGMHDVAVVGAGPAGIAAGLAAKKLGLRYLVFDQQTIGGSILHYPARKIVMTSPVELPLWGQLKHREISKEALLGILLEVIDRTGLEIRENTRVVDIQPSEGGYRIATTDGESFSRTVVLAMGRRGTPRKLGVPGEELPKVMYRLLDAEGYAGNSILVVGGGDSAVEAAVGLALSGKNRVTLSYRKSEFVRIKERNRKHLNEQLAARRIQLLMNSSVQSILPSVVVLGTPSGETEIPNDYVFVFAGGDMPFEFLSHVGVQFHAQAVD